MLGRGGEDFRILKCLVSPQQISYVKITVLFVEEPSRVSSRPTGFVRGCSTKNIVNKLLTESVSDGLPTFFLHSHTLKVKVDDLNFRQKPTS